MCHETGTERACKTTRPYTYFYVNPIVMFVYWLGSAKGVNRKVVATINSNSKTWHDDIMIQELSGCRAQMQNGQIQALLEAE
jgi:hypothetical protein